MWTRRDLKSDAKIFLRKFYWQSFVVILILSLAGTFVNGHWESVLKGNFLPKIITERLSQKEIPFETSVVEVPVAEMVDTSEQPWYIYDFYNFVPMGLNKLFKLTGVVAIIGVLISFAISFFVIAPLGVGAKKFFIDGATEDDVNFGHLGFAFKQEYYLNVVWVLFYRTILNFLFTLLLIIPGIIKGYAYSMVPYLLAEDPSLSAAKAIEISEAMTEGHKWDMFVLNLSFILWNLLQFMTFNLSAFFVAPYIEATWTQLYFVLKPVEPQYNKSLDVDF